MSFKNIFDGFLGSNAATGIASGLVGGLAGSLLTSKAGRKMGKNALKLGGVAAVGAIAYGAYKKYASNQSSQVANQSDIPTNIVPESNFLPQENDSASIHELELVLVKAMIAASRADGEVDVQETQKIFKQIRSFNLEQKDEFQLINQFNKTSNIDELVQSISSIELATEVYTVSYMVIEDANPAEREYLSLLATQLKLPSELVNAIEREVSEHNYEVAA